MVDAVHEDHTDVRTLRSSPLPQEAGKVADVVGDQDAVFVGCEGEHIVVTEPLERELLIERADVVSLSFQRAPNPGPGDVRVE